MATHMYEPDMYVHLDELLDPPAFQDNIMEIMIAAPPEQFHSTFISSELTGDLPASPLFNHDQAMNIMPSQHTVDFEMGHIDPSFVSTPSASAERIANQWIQNDHFATYTKQNRPVHGTCLPIISAHTPPHPKLESPPPPPRVSKAPKPRCQDKKKASEPLETREKKRVHFLERNRVAAAKCRQKKRRKWDALEEESQKMRAQNQSLREMCEAIADDVQILRSWAAEHRSCGAVGVPEWGGRAKLADAIGDQMGDREIKQESQSNMIDDGGMACDEIEGFLVADGHSLSSARKSSAASISYTSSPGKIPSPADSGVDMNLAQGLACGKAGTIDQHFGGGSSEELIPEMSTFSFGHFAGEQEALRVARYFDGQDDKEVEYMYRI